MASLKVVLRKKENKDGTFPLAIRITKDGKSSYIYLGQNLHPNEWDDKKQQVKKSHPNATRLNNLILKRKAEANDTLIDMQTKGKDASAGAVKKQIKPKDGVSFFAQSKVFLDNMRKAGKYNRVVTEECRIKRFRLFLDDADIAFGDISVPLLNRYAAWLKGEYNLAERSIVNNLMIIRTIYNQAIAAQIVDTKTYPFGKGKISIKLPDSAKAGITTDELHRLETVELSGLEDHARNVWLFSFYIAGMRVSDVLRLKWADIADGRISYVMGKNNKAGSVKIPDKALALLDKYKEEKPKLGLVFPELKILDTLQDTYEVQRKISYAIKQLNKYIERAAAKAKIEKKITCHISRHTFAQIAADKVPVQILQKLYRHSNISTTMGYQSNFTTKHTDDALDAVIGK
ncbi:tyrosine-type recombinase/integrase [Rufibacter sediminis]|uniref:Tyrosine-type recombinase/integrase n=1 Tax=Rufibacter sediminis TaxID=2762756 RepID=A0ABR6VTT1_9BACT|nr:site-specific integrase [Rufibacter sediminis]MBC3540612.1 tyrosine-type recombinase/integrase [Rufibacter sediminis]